MVALRDGVERRVDYATVGDRLFVNNVSLGVYATIVQEDEYRDAKRETTQEKLPELLGRQAEPFDLQFPPPRTGRRSKAPSSSWSPTTPLRAGAVAGRLAAPFDGQRTTGYLRGQRGNRCRSGQTGCPRNDRAG